mgnify:CR=1 FL=1
MGICRNVRNGAFETNSSSSHTICMTYTDSFNDIIPEDDNGKINIFPGIFDWEPETFNDAATKASYCFTSILYNIDEKKLKNKKSFSKDEIMSALEGDEVKIFFSMLDEVLEDNLSKSILYNIKNDLAYPLGYIDHQSQDVPCQVFGDKNTLMNFIFNPSSTLIVTNDNIDFSY